MGVGSESMKMVKRRNTPLSPTELMGKAVFWCQEWEGIRSECIKLMDDPNMGASHQRN